jgi:predicted anti-sigma-YlaC factor YlaD
MHHVTSEPPLDCAEVVRSLWDYVDGRAQPATVEAIEDHLALCAGCRAFAEFERRFVASLADLRGRHSDPARLRDDVLRVLRNAGMENGRSSTSTPEDGG